MKKICLKYKRRKKVTSIYAVKRKSNLFAMKDPNKIYVECF